MSGWKGAAMLAAAAAAAALLLAGALLAPGCGPRGGAEAEFPELTGPYLGQEPPGRAAKTFAPGIVSTPLYERDIAMTPDGDEIYWMTVVGNFVHTVITVSYRVDGRWTEPAVAPFSGDPRYLDIEPAISPDGRHFLFASNRPHEPDRDAREDMDLWIMDRVDGVWTNARPLPAPVNSERSEYFPSMTAAGVLYFTSDMGPGTPSSIYRTRPTGDGWSEPERLPDAVNAGQNRYNAFVAPDESYLIVPIAGREDSRGGTDYYVCFRDTDDHWTGPFHLGFAVNSPTGQEWSPYVSPDGEYFFFMGSRLLQRAPEAAGPLTLPEIRAMTDAVENGLPNIYWVQADLIEALRP